MIVEAVVVETVVVETIVVEAVVIVVIVVVVSIEGESVMLFGPYTESLHEAPQISFLSPEQG